MKLLRWLTNWGMGFYMGRNPWQPAEKERKALALIVERLSDKNLDTLGREIRDLALKGLG